MRYRRAKARMVGAVHGVAARREEDRVRHAGIVPLLGVMHHLHAERLVGAGRRREAGGAGRHIPAIATLPSTVTVMVWVGLSIWMRMVACAGWPAAQAKPSTSKMTAKSRSRFMPADIPHGRPNAPPRYALSLAAPTALVTAARRSPMQLTA